MSTAQTVLISVVAILVYAPFVAFVFSQFRGTKGDTK